MKAKDNKTGAAFQLPLINGKPFKKMDCAPACVAISHAPAKKRRYQEDRIANTLTWTRGPLTVRIDKCGKPLSDEAQRLFDFLGLELTKLTTGSLVRVAFSAYAEFRGDLDEKARQRLRQKVVEALEILLNTHITWVNAKKNSPVLRANILGSYVALDESKQTIQVNFTDEYAQYAHYMKNNCFMTFDTRLGRLPARYPNLYKIARKLEEHYWMPSNMEKNIHDRLSVTSLLNAAPDIPTWEEVRDKDRAYRQKIITPLEKCLDVLVDVGILAEWTWWKAGGAPLTPEELDRADYDTLKDCVIHYHYTDPSRELPDSGVLT